MTTEKQKMLAGELYDPLDPELCQERQRCRDLCKLFNDSREEQQEERKGIIADLLGSPTDVWIQPPFFCDYGTNISLGAKVFFNFNCVVLDVMQVKIGSNVLFGPSVQIYTATHPINAVTTQVVGVRQADHHWIRRLGGRWCDHLPWCHDR